MSLTEQIRQFVLDSFYVPEDMAITEDASLIHGGIVDSTGVLEIAEFVEEQWGVRIEDHEMLPENLDTIARIAKLVQQKQGTQVRVPKAEPIPVPA